MSTKTVIHQSTVWEEPNAVQIKVTLDYIEPPIWRRLVVPLTTTLSELHHILQAAMGWTGTVRFGRDRQGGARGIEDTATGQGTIIPYRISRPVSYSSADLD